MPLASICLTCVFYLEELERCFLNRTPDEWISIPCTCDYHVSMEEAYEWKTKELEETMEENSAYLPNFIVTRITL